MRAEQEFSGSQSPSSLRKLSELAEQSARCTLACCGAVATVTDGSADRPAATHPDLAGLVAVQLATGEGPVPAALDAGEPVHTEDLLDEDRWPEYRAAALDSGVRACVTLPFRRAGLAVTISLFSFRPGTLGAAAHGPVTVLGDMAAAGMVRDRRYMAALSEVGQLENALRSRPVIDQASGILMHVLGCGADEAFATLRRISQRTNRKLADVAEAVVRTRGLGLERDLSLLAEGP
ncbi:ANTAR domain-containing protein [Streptomyces sp. NPDC051219]|uniref:ANTAR domain-containing response regulator n=1 Tax=Streptomyces sp. NPDC051219 TaxID=3155283 RepID=UPI003415F2AA